MILFRSLVFLVVGVSSDCNIASTIFCNFPCKTSSVRWMRFSSFVSIVLAFMYTNSTLTDSNGTRASEITETAKDILLILSADFVYICFFVSIIITRSSVVEPEGSVFVWTGAQNEMKINAWRARTSFLATSAIALGYQLRTLLFSSCLVQQEVGVTSGTVGKRGKIKHVQLI